MNVLVQIRTPKLAKLGVALAGCLAVLAGAAMTPQPVEAKATSRNPEDLLVVDCLLPGQVRKLGSQATFMSARRPIRTTQADCEIRGGEYVAYDRANYQTALKVWMDQAMAGSAEAQNYVGEIYLKGLGTAPDYTMAAAWLQKAADQGSKRAKINLGYMYEQGLGVTKDLSRALNLYREASGSTDELLFASTVRVELQAKDTQISSLQQTVEQQRAESEALKAQVKELQGQLDSRRRALQTSQAELKAAQQKLADARQKTGADFAAIDQQRASVTARTAEVERLQAALEAERANAAKQGSEAQLAAQQRAESLQSQLVSNQALLEQERAQYEAKIAELEKQASGRKQEDWDLMKLLENQLAQREAEIARQQQQIASLEQRVSTEGGALLAAAPTLEIIDPPLTVTRGRPSAMLRSAPGRQSLVGKVTQPRAIREITVNGTPVILGDNGLFRASVDVAEGGSIVQIAAVDQRGGQAALEFSMIPQAGGNAQAQGAGSDAEARLGVPSGLKLGGYHAIVIGNNTYQSSGFQPLQSAVNDATAVAQLLKTRYGYKTSLVLNATRFEMLSALNEAREALGPEDNLLIYYAGHGELSADGKQGYWIPTDAQPGQSNTWVSNTSISEILDTMQAKHVLVVADSCYSGALTRAAMPIFDTAVIPPDKWDAWVKNTASGRSRTALTSGGIQPVPDTGTGKHSYFARAFMNALEDNNRLLEAQRLYREITSSLALAAVDSPVPQVPEYSPIQFAGHETGDFFFLPSGSGKAGP